MAGYIGYLKGLEQSGALSGLQSGIGSLEQSLNLPGPIQDQINAANYALMGEEVCGPICAGIGGAIGEAIAISKLLVDAFSGVPRTQKTIETAQRLMQSTVIPVAMLGNWWNKAGGANIIDSNAPDITQYFKPAFDFTIQTLGIPFASPAWYALSQVIGEGQPASLFDQTYGAQNLPKPMFVTQQAFSIEHPDDPYPQKLVEVYQLLAPDFTKGITPVTPVQPGGPPPTTPIPVTPGQGGCDTQQFQDCCHQIVESIVNIAATLANMTTATGLGDMPALVQNVGQIANQLMVIVQQITSLLSTLGQGTTGLGQALQTVANALETTVTNAAGQEVNALSGLSQAIVNALGKIDVDSENSLAGVAHAITNMKPVDLSKIEDELKCICAQDGSMREFIANLSQQGSLDPDTAARFLAALPQTIQ